MDAACRKQPRFRIGRGKSKQVLAKFVYFVSKYHQKQSEMDFIQPVLAVLLSVLMLSTVEAYFINIDAHAEECFFDKVVSGTKMSLMFEVAEGGFLDIDVKVNRCSLRVTSRSGDGLVYDVLVVACNINLQFIVMGLSTN